MGNTPSINGPYRGRSHVKRDDNSVDSSRGQRPVQSRVEETAEEFSDEEADRKSSSLSVPESHLSYTMSKFVKVMLRILWPLFFAGHGL